MLGVFAEFETNLRKERQAAGIAKAKAERPEAYQGKPASVDGDAIRNLLDSGMKPTDIAKKLNVIRATVYRYKSG
jgi:DNA invertase Pin-like site-specific DNA recombinase